MDKEYKCAWKHCKFDNVIKEDESYEVIGGRRYHTECNCEREDINECITLFTEQVNSQIVITQLRSVINNLIFKQGFESEYVVFAIQYAINHPEYKLTYPQGLHRICKDQTIVNTWKTQKANSVLQGQKIVIDKIDKSEKIKYNTTQKKKSVSDFFS